MTSAASSPSKPAPPWRRVWEWLWRTQAVLEAQRRQAEHSQLRYCDQRARIAIEVAERVVDPTTPWMAGGADHLAAGLYVEAIGWSLRVAAGSVASTADADLRPAGPTELAELAATKRSLLLDAAGDADVLTRLLEQLQERRFESRAPSSAESQQAARELGKVARALQRATALREDDLDTLYYQRLVRVGLGALGLVALIVGLVGLRETLERRGDLAVGKPWTASSSYEVVCESPQHSCEGNKSYFFHTQQEKNPWLEIDLQAPQSFSKVWVSNRQDCCAERAVPLVVEVSDDEKHWREVARRTTSFDDWKAQFSPVAARFVRFRVEGRSILHLADVRVLK